MEILEGHLTMLGNSSIYRKATVYSVIEMEDKVFQKLIVPNSLDNFLNRALNQSDLGNYTTLYIQGTTLPKLYGIRLPDGKLFYYKISSVPIWTLVACGALIFLILCTLSGGFALAASAPFFLSALYFKFKHSEIEQDFLKNGGIPIRL